MRLFSLLSAVGLLSLAVSAAHAAAPPAVVAVSVAPEQMLVERIGGEAVQVLTVVAPGHNPATYEPTPRQVAQLADAELYLAIGVPFERSWLPRLRAVNPAMPVVDLLADSAVGPLAGHDHGEHDHDAHHLDPHVWTDPLRLKALAAAVHERLTVLRPQAANGFDTRLKALMAELDALDAEVRAALTDASGRQFVVYHPAWGYYAQRYGLQQIAIEQDGKAPGSRTLAALIERTRKLGVQLVITQPQFDDRAARQLARVIGARVESIDPLGYEVLANIRRLTALLGGEGA